MEAPREVIERVAKLLRLAEGRANPHEAALAAAKAAELMERHRIDRAMLEGAEDIEPIQESGALHEAQLLAGWVAALARGIALSQGCDVVAHKSMVDGRVRLTIVGRLSDTTVTRYLFVYVKREIERLVAESAARGLLREEGAENDYKAGAVGAVLVNLADRKRGARQDAPSNALVKLDQREKEVADWMKARHPHMHTGQIQVREPSSQTAFWRGVAGGAAIPLNPGLETGQTALKLKAPK